jgi:hypothetical protein
MRTIILSLVAAVLVMAVTACLLWPSPAYDTDLRWSLMVLPLAFLINFFIVKKFYQLIKLKKA